MDCMGGHINPLQLVDSIPAGLAIPRLRDRLCTIIADFRTQQSLREACNVILQHDCLRLAQVLLGSPRGDVAPSFVGRCGAHAWLHRRLHQGVWLDQTSQATGNLQPQRRWQQSSSWTAG